MTALARKVFRFRRAVGQRWALLVVAGVWPLLGLGVIGSESLRRGDLSQLSVITLLAVTLLWTVLRETRAERSASHAVVRELELGLLLVTGVYVLLAVTGGARSFLYPLVYAVVSFLMVIHRFRVVAVGTLVAVVALEVLLASRTGGEHANALAAYHLSFVGFFAAGNLLVLAGLVRRLRRDHDKHVADELHKMRQEARDFRLIASALPPQSRSRKREDEELRMAHAAVQSIHEQLFHNLDLLRTSMGLRTCALIWCQDDGAHREGRKTPTLVVKELATSSDLVCEQPQLSSAGILTSVVADPKPLRLKALGGKRVPPYYQGPEPITDVCAVPLMEGAVLRGILCADRNDDRPFEQSDERVLAQAADHILRVIEHERTFTAVERSKYEQEQFYRASELLNEALTLDQVYERSFAAIRAIAHYDIAVVSGVVPGRSGQQVLAVDVAAEGEGACSWRGLAEQLHERVFDDSTSLVSIALKNRHFMPATGEHLDPDAVIFDAQTKIKGAKSLLVLPLTRGEQVLGSLTLAATRPRQYPSQIREMLRVISHQCSVSLQNARMYQSMELRATTDGLTGLTNHRAFQERLSQLHALAERTGQKYAIILTDIDHFKSINDTYGHPVGDQVLKRVSALFAGRARKVDIVARYGGEEFVLVLPDTDAAGAELFANRLREEVAAQVMTSEHGTFKITISMGIAEFPSDGAERLELIERADQALYYCKEHGRNCVHRFSSSG